MSNIITFINENWVEIGVILFFIHTIGTILSIFTETKSDDKFFKKMGIALRYIFIGKSLKK